MLSVDVVQDSFVIYDSGEGWRGRGRLENAEGGKRWGRPRGVGGTVGGRTFQKGLP